MLVSHGGNPVRGIVIVGAVISGAGLPWPWQTPVQSMLWRDLYRRVITASDRLHDDHKGACRFDTQAVVGGIIG